VKVIEKTSIIITSQAQTINCKGYGLKLHIPQYSLPPDFEQCRLLIKVISGQFKLPENTFLVSAVYWLDSEPGIIFSKHLTVEIQHCATSTSRLSFVSAKHLHDTFDAVEKGEFSHGSVYGRVQLNHFSLWGIVCKMSDWLTGNQQLLYCGHLYYMNKEINLRHIHYVITKNLEVDITVSFKSAWFYMLVIAVTCCVFLQHVKQTYTARGATDHCDEGMPVVFESSSISLDLPSDDVTLGDGWKILSYFLPTVKKVFCALLDKICDWDKCFNLQIYKNEVDTFCPGKRIPSCHLKAEWTKQSNPSRLTYKVNLEGAKQNSYFLIELNCDSTPPGIYLIERCF